MHVALRAPGPEELRAVLAATRDDDLAVAPGSTDGPCPAGMQTNELRSTIATAAMFDRARALVLGLGMFDLPWMRALAGGPGGVDTVAVGTDVAVAGKVLGAWWTNVCRVTRIVDEPDRGGFVYTTLRSHMMRGEEVFAVRRDRARDCTWFELRSHSRPVHPLARAGWPLVRAMQRRFARESVVALVRALARTPA